MQSYFRTPIARLNSTHYILMKIGNKKKQYIFKKIEK